jgi:hypothetical protein
VRSARRRSPATWRSVRPRARAKHGVYRPSWSRRRPTDRPAAARSPRGAGARGCGRQPRRDAPRQRRAGTTSVGANPGTGRCKSASRPTCEIGAAAFEAEARMARRPKRRGMIPSRRASPA